MKQDYHQKHVLIFGLGLNEGGVGSAKFFAKQGALVRITDLKDETILQPSINQLKDFKNIEYSLGKHTFEDIEWADLIIKNPSVKPNNEFIKYAKKNNKLIETDIGIFLEYINPKQIIGITGTKGKSTTATLIYEILSKSLPNKKVIFAGNIGKSVLNTIPHLTEETLVVLEISSFQLEAFDQHQVSPHIAVITNIYPDHLNYYSSMEEYIAAKKLITKYQTSEDLLLLRKNDPITAQVEFLSDIKSQIGYFSKDDLPANFNPQILGKHNRDNIAAAMLVSSQLGINHTESLRIAESFKGVEFRMQLVKIWQGVKIYNDTTATGPDAACKAFESFPNQVIAIIGGMNKNMPYENLAVCLDEKAKMIFFLTGDIQAEIEKYLSDKSKIKGSFNNLEELLKVVKINVKSGDIVLFSPGGTSFNLFQNEFDRGRKFNQAVESVFS